MRKYIIGISCSVFVVVIVAVICKEIDFDFNKVKLLTGWWAYAAYQGAAKSVKKSKRFYGSNKS